MAAILGRLFKGFGESFADTKKEKNREKLERERMAKQDAQFQQSLALQREQVSAANARNDRLDAFMMKRGEREDTRADKRDLREDDEHRYKLMQLESLYGDPGILAKEREARSVGLDAKIAESGAYIKNLPMEQRRAVIRGMLDEEDLSARVLDRKIKSSSFDTAEKLKPYHEALVKAQSREADARALLAEADTTKDALDIKRAKDYIGTLRESAGLIAQLGTIAGEAEDRKLKTLHLSAQQLSEITDRYTKLVSAGVAKDVARDLIKDSYVVGHAIVNKDIARHFGGGSPEVLGETMKWYANAAKTVLEGDPQQAAALLPQMKVAFGQAVQAFNTYGKEQREAGAMRSEVQRDPFTGEERSAMVPGDEADPTKPKSGAQRINEATEKRLGGTPFGPDVLDKLKGEARQKAGVFDVKVGGEDVTFTPTQDKSAKFVEKWASENPPKFEEMLARYTARTPEAANRSTDANATALRDWLVDYAKWYEKSGKGPRDASTKYMGMVLRSAQEFLATPPEKQTIQFRGAPSP